MRSSACLGLLLLTAVASDSVAHRLPEARQIEQERQRIEVERKQLFDPNNPDTKHVPQTFPGVPTPKTAGIDIETMAKQYAQKITARKQDDLMIFVSFTMPAESLKRIVNQANQVGASVFLKGFKNNSFKETALAIQQLGNHNGNVSVSPNAFKKYQINAVPTVVVATTAATEQVDPEGQAVSADYAAVSGDISLDYALEAMQRQAPTFAPMASRYLRQLRGNE